MAKRTLNRRELRQQSDAAEALARTADAAPDAESDSAAADAPAKKKTKKAAKPRAPRAKVPRKKKAAQRMFAHWGVFDGAMKQLALFDYSQRAAADEKLADLVANKKGTFFLQIVKEPRAEAPAELTAEAAGV